MTATRIARICVPDPDGSKRYLLEEVNRLCDRVIWCQSSRYSGDLDAGLHALEQQRCVVERMLAQIECVTEDTSP